MNEIDIVRDISKKFGELGIAYMLTGSMAMNYYAQPHMTRAIDVVIAVGLQDVERVIELFRPDYYVSEQSMRESLAQESIFNLIHNESVIKVDSMSDAPESIRAMVRNQIMARSGEERFVMGAQMFEAAVEMVKASLPRDLSPTERKRRLFERIYGKELNF